MQKRRDWQGKLRERERRERQRKCVSVCERERETEKREKMKKDIFDDAFLDAFDESARNFLSFFTPEPKSR